MSKAKGKGKKGTKKTKKGTKIIALSFTLFSLNNFPHKFAFDNSAYD